MKSIIRWSILSLTLLLFAGTFAASAKAGERTLPLEGTFTAVETHTGFPVVVLALQGGGEASLLGRFSFTQSGWVNVVIHVGAATGEYRAANGDRIFTEGSGAATPIPGTTLVVVTGTSRITGGTGRFAGATGSMSEVRVLDPVTLISSGTFTGTVTLP